MLHLLCWLGLHILSHYEDPVPDCGYMGIDRCVCGHKKRTWCTDFRWNKETDLRP